LFLFLFFVFVFVFMFVFVFVFVWVSALFVNTTSERGDKIPPDKGKSRREW